MDLEFKFKILLTNLSDILTGLSSNTQTYAWAKNNILKHLHIFFLFVKQDSDQQESHIPASQTNLKYF